ncbi:hypothetical protein [Campylobacter sp. CN_NA1]|uniref:hypothetical protein n=1 Tax=Campylobacter sp. CN_NA1 TaxID=2984150 RepID=UPI0022E999C0|nr:hypothetical protein [Campylobacter sp. CN_NA1]MDA3056430.1 hypothetical protein [Campylobacter sp. CN_NA1]
MPYFNPKPLVFNPDSKVIEASGAIGQSLFEIMKENTKREQENARLAEAKRANLQNEAMKEKQFDFDNTKFDYAKQKDERDFTWDTQKWKTQFEADQRHKRATEALGWANHNLARQRHNFSMQQLQAEQERAKQAQEAENMAYFDYGVKNGAFGDIANSQEFANLTPQQKASYGANLKAQMNAQGQIYKANEPLFKMQEQERARQEALRQEQARNLQIAQMAYENPQGFGLNKQEIALLGEIQKRANSGDTQAQADLMEIGRDFSQKLQTQSEINKNLGIKPQTAEEKRAIAKVRNQVNLTLNSLHALDKMIYDDNKMGGIDQNSGLIDKAIYSLATNWSDDASTKSANVENYARTRNQQLKGMGKYNYETTKENFTPDITGSGVASENMLKEREQLINDLEILANQMIANGEAQGYEYLEQANNLKMSEEQLKNIIYGKQKLGNVFGAYNPEIDPEKIQNLQRQLDNIEAKFRAKNRAKNNDFYEQADEHGGHYMQ